MKVRTLLLLFSVAITTGLVDYACAEEPADKDTTATVTLSLIAPECDVNKPSEGVMKCVIRNGTVEPIFVPTSYDGNQVKLQFGRLTLRIMGIPRGKVDPKKEDERVKILRIEPGDEKLVLELPLDKILLMEDTIRGEWAWSWQRRPEPPQSPIHRWRELGFHEKADFQFSLEINGKTVTSNLATSKVISTDPKK